MSCCASKREERGGGCCTGSKSTRRAQDESGDSRGEPHLAHGTSNLSSTTTMSPGDCCQSMDPRKQSSSSEPSCRERKCCPPVLIAEVDKDFNESCRDETTKGCCTGSAEEKEISSPADTCCSKTLVGGDSCCGSPKEDHVNPWEDDRTATTEGSCKDGPNHGITPAVKCCEGIEGCICNENCLANYASLLHHQSGCRRASLAPSTVPNTYPALERSPKSPLSCAHCLRNARPVPTLSTSGADVCYCNLTRSLCKSVKSLAAVEFSAGCCNVDNIRNLRMNSEDCPAAFEEDELLEIMLDEKTAAHDGDIELGPSFTRSLHLGVVGMHCQSCADGVESILRKIPGIDHQGVIVNFMLGRAGLGYDPSVISNIPIQIIERIKKRFPKLEIVVLTDTEVDSRTAGIMQVRVRSASHGAEKLKEALDEVGGVEMVMLIGEHEVELSYEPTRVGIRAVLAALRERSGFSDVELGDVPDVSLEARKAESRHLRKMAILTAAALLLTLPVLVLSWSGNNIKIEDTPRFGIECACATGVIIVAHRIYLDAFWALIYGTSGGFLSRINMDTLVSIATLSAYGFSVAVFAVHTRGSDLGDGTQKEPFFETSALLTTLILCGRLMTGYVRSWASKKLRTVGDGNLQTSRPRFLDPQTGEESRMDALELEYGDGIVVGREETVATDGIIISGIVQADESHLTGEPRPQTKKEGSYLLAGSKIVSGEAKFRVLKLVQENTVSTIKGMVTLATQQKPRVQAIADKIAAGLTPIILVIAVFVFFGHAAGRSRVLGWNQAAITAATYAVATIAISCPCALALAVPMVLVVGSRVGVTKGGFVFKNPAAVEKARNIDAVVFDKTGTLTTGGLHVEKSWAFVKGEWFNEVPQQLCEILKVLCKGDEHPAARAMLHFANVNSVSKTISPGFKDVMPKTTVSQGVEAEIGGVFYIGGRLSFTAAHSANDPEIRLRLKKSRTVFTLSADSELVAMFSLGDDAIRTEAPAVLQNLRERNIEVYIFSGDRKEAVIPIAEQLGIPPSNVYSDCFPEDKKARLEELRSRQDSAVTSKSKVLSSLNPWQRCFQQILALFWSQDPKPKCIVFVGDGNNDAVALAAADIGISLSQASEMASSSADVAIISDSLVGVLSFLDLSRRMVFCIRANFIWAVIWNLVAILGASGAWVNARIAPEWAGLGEIGSVLPVFIISALVGWRYKQ